MATVQAECTPAGNSLPAHVLDELWQRFGPRRAGYVACVLTGDELAVVSDLADALVIARIKRMGEQRLDRFDDLVPADAAAARFYHSLQLRWLHTEEYLLTTRLGRKPTHGELFADFMTNDNGRRFRAYFALKYPQHVRPTSRAVGALP
ncbi:MAG TPA: hypothetical protein VFB66_12085 [Tepidisphaeraceae bacterium]|nr:hypothetical protein [Tepidisphaeraceae bacterium]